LQASDGTEPTQLNLGNLSNVIIQTRVLLTEGALQLSVRNSGKGGYAVLLRSDGQVGLFRDGALLQAAGTSPWTPGSWRMLEVSALDNTVRVVVDGAEAITYTDTAPLPAGGLRCKPLGWARMGWWWMISCCGQSRVKPSPHSHPLQPRMSPLHLNLFSLIRLLQPHTLI